MVVVKSTQLIGNGEKAVTECLVCKGPVEVKFQTLAAIDQLIRKTECMDCHARTFSRVKMATPINQPTAGNFECKNCKRTTSRVYMHHRGLVCKECFDLPPITGGEPSVVC